MTDSTLRSESDSAAKLGSQPQPSFTATVDPANTSAVEQLARDFNDLSIPKKHSTRSNPRRANNNTSKNLPSKSVSPSDSMPHLNVTKLDGLTIVLKIGTSSVCDPVTHVPLLSTLYSIVQVIHKLKLLGHNIVLVSSGAVGTGLKRLNIEQKPKEIAKLQAIAAVGQGRLMALWDNMFSYLDQPIAQVLLTRNDLSHPAQYVNAYNTFMELLSMGVIPIVNENDTVSLGQIRFGDNDTLSAITAGMIHADYLFLLTDVDCLYTDNPRNNPDAKRVLCVEDMKSLDGCVDATTAGSSVGTGGMATKLIAAELAMSAGVCTVITHSSKPHKIIDIIDFLSDPKNKPANTIIPEEILCTRFVPTEQSLGDRKWWIRHGMRKTGTIYVDYGALTAIAKYKKSLFAAGVVSVEGNFSPSQSVCVAIKTALIPPERLEKAQIKKDVLEIAYGLVNYSSTEISRIKGCKSTAFEAILGYIDTEEIIHRGNLVLGLNKLDFDLFS
ncbi:hypothetical protein BB561_005870 [Smittium simulii]|uniref:PUA domain-containing protein n=1 Tax=Smittium simulii TaxID=133385 RepID=A0A2T9Y7X9_9FUNG|nr:hypothetical protein BB561_005870 [Smittium simulii]